MIFLEQLEFQETFLSSQIVSLKLIMKVDRKTSLIIYKKRTILIQTTGGW